MVMIRERGIYTCKKCGNDYFKKRHKYKLSTDHKKLFNNEEVPVKDVKVTWVCAICGEVLDLGQHN